MPDLNDFQIWVDQGKRRKASIELYSNGNPQILVGDYDEGGHYHCQMVHSVSQINIEKETQKHELEELSRLKAKYEPEVVNQ